MFGRLVRRGVGSAGVRDRDILDQPDDGAPQWPEFFVDDVLYDGMVGVEVVVGELVSHASYHPPNECRVRSPAHQDRCS
jgi:hypothetical protein